MEFKHSNWPSCMKCTRIIYSSNLKQQQHNRLKCEKLTGLTYIKNQRVVARLKI